MEKQISIIIPTYNMEAYIGKCLDSLLIPEFDKVEVLVVNDGSKDRSSEIAHDYSSRYPESIRVIDKPNGNYGSCINAALPLCTGRYVKILDADDTFDTSAFSKFVRQLPECYEDVLITNHIIVSPEGKVLDNSAFSKDTLLNEKISVESAHDTIASKYIQMHRISYNLNIFKRFNYFQTEKISYTDSQWAIIPLAYGHSFRCIDLCVYKYLIGREGQTMEPKQIAKFLNNFFSVLKDSLKYYLNFTEDKISKDIFKRLLIEQHEYIYFNVLRNISIESTLALKQYDIHLKEVCPDIYEEINKIKYSPEINYNVFKDIRSKNYSHKFKIPILRRIELSLKTKFLS